MPASLRARAAIGAVVVVGAALLVGSVAMVLLTRSSLTGNVREAAELRAEDVATALEAGAAEPADLAVEDEEDAFIQVVDADGAVVASSTNIDGLPAVTDLGDDLPESDEQSDTDHEHGTDRRPGPQRGRHHPPSSAKR